MQDGNRIVSAAAIANDCLVRLAGLIQKRIHQRTDAIPFIIDCGYDRYAHQIEFVHLLTHALQPQSTATKKARQAVARTRRLVNGEPERPILCSTPTSIVPKTLLSAKLGFTSQGPD